MIMINGKTDKKAGGYLLPDKKCYTYFNNLRKPGFILKAGKAEGLERQRNSQEFCEDPWVLAMLKG